MIRIDSGKRQSRFSGVREGESSAFLATARRERLKTEEVCHMRTY